jgi:hypothetical protein
VRVIEITNTLFGRNAEHLNVTAAHKCVPRGVVTLMLGRVGAVMMPGIQKCNVTTSLTKCSGM